MRILYIYNEMPSVYQHYLVDRYNLQENINIKGKIERTKLLDNLTNYDFFVQLSVSESLGMSVIEAQSQGIPVLISNSHGLLETVIKDKTALVMDYKNTDAMAENCIELWKNEEAYYSLSKQAISNANDKFTTDKEVELLHN